MAPVQMLGGHKTWTDASPRTRGRKPDPPHSMDWRRKRVAAVLAKPVSSAAVPEEFTMDAQTRSFFWKQPVTRGTGTVSAIQELADAKTIALRNEARIKALQAVVARLSDDEANVTAAVERAAAEVKDAIVEDEPPASPGN
jgi:hypothetical protein